MSTWHGIGLMSGTSLDGLDIAYCSFSEKEDGWDFQLLESDCIRYPRAWEKRLRDLEKAEGQEYALAHVEFGRLLAEITESFIRLKKIEPQFVASHGHTLFHRPEKHFTAQIGCGETLSALLNCPVVTNFRVKDVARGGQGAPLVPFGEKHLFEEDCIFLNLGGFANISWKSMAFDVSPCNMALNFYAGKHDNDLDYDAEGRIAASGHMDDRLFQKLNALSYYALPGPKSLGREWWESTFRKKVEEFDLRPADKLRTIVEHVAFQVAVAVRMLRAKGMPILITGGGARNDFLMSRIRARLEPLKVTVKDASPEVGDYKEAIIFAFLGLQTLLGRPNVLKSVTGADMDVCGGSIHLPPAGWGKSLI